MPKSSRWSSSSKTPSAVLPSKPVQPAFGLIAGRGEFPLLVAREAKARGSRVVAVAFPEETDTGLANEVDEIHWVSLGQLGKITQAFKRAGIQEAAMAGQIRHKQLFAHLKLDLQAVRLLAGLKDKRADSILRAVADHLERAGTRLISPLPLLKPYLPAKGRLTRRKPTAQEEKDIEFGYRIAKHVAGADIGQTVVVKNGAVVAVEALEGTDACIVRSGEYAGPGIVVVKVTKPSQDLRFDTPVIGPRTIASLVQAKAAVMAFDSETTLVIQKELTLETANQAKITLIAL